MPISINKIFYAQVIIVIMMILGILPQQASYLILVIMLYGFYKLNLLDSLGLFIISIPFFTAFPENNFSDSMSVWRILIAVLFVKMIAQAYKIEFSKEGMIAAAKAISRPLVEMQGKSYRKLFLLFILFLAINVLSLFVAQHPGAGVKKILFISNIVLLFPIVQAAARTREDALSIMKYLLSCSLIVVFVGYFQLLLTFFVPLFKFWQFWAGGAIVAFYGETLSGLLKFSNTWFSYYEVLPATLRMFSVFPDSHSFSLFVLLALPIMLFFIVHARGREKKRLIMILPFYFLALIFSGSRGVWAASVPALVVSFAYFTNFRPKIKNVKHLPDRIISGAKEKINPKIIPLSILIFFLVIPISSFVLRKNQEVQLMRSGVDIGELEEEEAMFKRLMSISDLYDVSNMGRIEIWNRTIESINEHYLLGVGAGNFPLVLDEKLSSSKMGSSAHSIYFDVAAETGVFGLLAFLLINAEILVFSTGLFRKELAHDEMKIFAGAFFAYFSWVAIYGLFDVVLFNDKVLMFSVIVISVLYLLKDKYPIKRVQ